MDERVGPSQIIFNDVLLHVDLATCTNGDIGPLALALQAERVGLDAKALGQWAPCEVTSATPRAQAWLQSFVGESNEHHLLHRTWIPAAQRILAFRATTFAESNED